MSGGACADDASMISSVTTDVISSTLVSETERDLLMADRSRLLGEIHAIVVKVERLKALHKHDKTECTKLENQRHQKMNNITTRRKKVVLLGLYLKQVSHLLNNLQSMTAKLEELFQREVSKTKSSPLVSCERGILSEDQRKVGELIEEVSTMFSSLLTGDLVHGRSDLRGRLVQSLGAMSALSTARSLIQFTESLSRKINLQRAGNPEESNVDLEDGFEESVKTSIAQMDKKLVLCYTATQKHLANVGLWRENVSQLMKKTSVGEEEISATQLSAQKASLAAGIAELRAGMAGQTINSAVVEDLVVQQLDTIDYLCGTISSLINHSSSSTLKISQLKTLETMSTTIPCLASELTKLSHGVENLPSAQLSVLGSAPLWKLSTTNLTGDSWVTMTPTSHLSILRKKEKFPAEPSQACSDREKTLTDLIQLLLSISRKEDILAEESGGQKENGKGLVLFEHLARTLQTNIKEQGRNLLPVISECGKQQREVLKQLGRFVELHQDWKTQPAAGVVEEEVFQWGEVEGKSLKQLQDIAKCYINKLGL